MTTEDVLGTYFASMRRGAEAGDDLLALFTADAVYDEPFTGQDPAVGIEQIRERFRQGWEFPLPDLELDVLEMEVDGPRASARWECRSPGLPGPIRGRDHYELTGGLISRLVVRIDDEASTEPTGT